MKTPRGGVGVKSNGLRYTLWDASVNFGDA